MHVCGALIPYQYGVSTSWGASAGNGFLRDCGGDSSNLAHMLRRAGSLAERNARDMQLPQRMDKEVCCDLRPMPMLTPFPAQTQVRTYVHREVSCMLLEKPVLSKFEAGTRARIYRLNDLHEQMEKGKGWKSFLAEPKSEDAWDGCFVCFDHPPQNLPPKT